MSPRKPLSTMIAPALPATVTFLPLPSPTKKVPEGSGVTVKAGVPWLKVRVRTSPVTVAETVGGGESGIAAAAGHEGDAGPDGVQATGLALDDGLAPQEVAASATSASAASCRRILNLCEPDARERPGSRRL